MSNPNQKPQFSKKFASGALFAEIGGHGGPGLLLCLATDYDVLRTQLEAALGRSHAPMDNAPWGMTSRSWHLNSEKQHDYVFENFFKQAVPPSEVRHRPEFNKLRLVAVDLDTPLIPNNWADS